MPYSATYYNSPGSLRRSASYAGTLGLVIVSAAALPQVLLYTLGIQLTICALALLLVALPVAAAWGAFDLRRPGQRLTLSADTLTLQPAGGNAYGVALAELDIRARIESYRPLGFLPRVRYIRLSLRDETRTPPRTLYFRHDSYFDAVTWDQLRIPTETAVGRAIDPKVDPVVEPSIEAMAA